MRIDKKIYTKVTVHDSAGNYLASFNTSINSIKHARMTLYPMFNQKIQVSLSQDGGYFKRFNMNGKKVRYQVLSPDKVPIFADLTYKDTTEALHYFNLWAKRFEAQGYYSCRGEKIDLRDLKDYCEVVIIK